MAAKLCCTAPQRSDSPATPNARQPSHPPTTFLPFTGTPQKHPILPAQPEITVLDGTELQRIFVAASLPEDHPHALRFPGRKPDFDESIVRSPGFRHKVQRQLSRKSLKSLKSEISGKSKDSGKLKSEKGSGKMKREEGSGKTRISFRKNKKASPATHGTTAPEAVSLLDEEIIFDGGYDPDAHAVTSQEVIQSVGENSEDPLPRYDGANESKAAVFGSVGSSKARRGDNGQLARSVIGSLEWLAPALRPRGTSPLPPQTMVAEAVESDQVDSTGSITQPMAILRSASMPNFAPLRTHITPVRQSRSDHNFSLLKPNCSMLGFSRRSLSTSELSSTANPGASACTNQGALRDSTNDLCAGVSETGRTQPEPASPTHLQDLNISRHLRTTSCLSTASHIPWTFHHRERSKISDSILHDASGHHRYGSGSAFDSAAVPENWGHVVRREPDAASSVYSRPSSYGDGEYTTAGIASRLNQPYNIPYDPPRKDANWPLPTVDSAAENLIEETDEGTADGITAYKGVFRFHSPSYGLDQEQSIADTDDSPGHTHERSEHVSFDDLPPSIPSKSSSSSFVKRSKFLEAFSPPKKTVKKRRSMFKFLRPGSHRSATRSASTPILTAASARLSDSVDGPSDDAGHLTVQYELSDHPRTRSSSMHDLVIEIQDEVPTMLAVPGQLERRSSLADYERRLSVAGDDRRRRSSINFLALEEVRQDDRRDSIQLKRPLKRAAPLHGTHVANPLMAKALEDHQTEKAAFFCVASRRASTAGLTEVAPTLGQTFGRAGSSLSPYISRQRSDGSQPMEDIDPLASAQRSKSCYQLQAPPSPHSESLCATRSAARSSVLSKKPSTPGTQPSPTQANRGRSRAVTPLASWSRYPSDTRQQRCGSAGATDWVITRDFAPNGDADNVLSDSSRAEETNPGKHAKVPLPKSRSMTVGSVWRYYSNMLSSASFAGQGRRTSIAMGRKLEYPELEMISPVLPAEPQHHHHHHLHIDSQKLDHIKEHVKEDAEKLLHHAQHNVERLSHHSQHEGNGLFHHALHEGDSLFSHQTGKEPDRPRLTREETSIGPMDGTAMEMSHMQEGSAGDGESPPPTNEHDTLISHETHSGPPAMALDGTADRATEPACAPSSTAGKAQQWSQMYESCVQLPPFADNCGVRERERLPPPTLKPAKPRSPAQPLVLDPNARVRRFPSVTVVDDKKGLWRSISFLTAKSSSEDGGLRASTQDLLLMVRQRETEEGQRLMAAERDVRGGALACY